MASLHSSANNTKWFDSDNEGFRIVKIEEAIESLVKKVVVATTPYEAATYSQAALNLANAANILRILNLSKECESHNQK